MANLRHPNASAKSIHPRRFDVIAKIAHENVFAKIKLSVLLFGPHPLF
jgi:hypothetical protein